MLEHEPALDAIRPALEPGEWKLRRSGPISLDVVDRIDYIVIEGPGTLVKGMIELDANGEIALASWACLWPCFPGWCFWRA